LNKIENNLCFINIRQIAFILWHCLNFANWIAMNTLCRNHLKYVSLMLCIQVVELVIENLFVCNWLKSVHVCICNKSVYMTSFQSYDKFYLLVWTCQQVYFDNLLAASNVIVQRTTRALANHNKCSADYTLTSFLCWPIQTNEIYTLSLTIFSMTSALVQKLACLSKLRVHQTSK
jgi:hypothetical protein